MCSEEESLAQIIEACLCKCCFEIYERKAEKHQEIKQEDFCQSCNAEIEKALEWM